MALQEICHYQKSTDLIIGKVSFQWSVQEIEQWKMTTLCFTADLITALKDGIEIHLVRLFEDTNLCAIFVGRVTITLKDVQFVRHICEEWTLNTAHELTLWTKHSDRSRSTNFKHYAIYTTVHATYVCKAQATRNIWNNLQLVCTP